VRQIVIGEPHAAASKFRLIFEENAAASWFDGAPKAVVQADARR
jgi:hypothetical protein